LELTFVEIWLNLLDFYFYFYFHLFIYYYYYYCYGEKGEGGFSDKNPKTNFFPFLFLILQEETKNPWLSLSSWEDSNNKFHGKDKKMFVSLQGVCWALPPQGQGLSDLIQLLEVLPYLNRFHIRGTGFLGESVWTV
jgi:hypothetical protein